MNDPYRVRVQFYRLVKGERQYQGEARIKSFEHAWQAATFFYTAAFKIGNCEVRATGPDGNGGRRWMTLQELRSIRKEN